MVLVFKDVELKFRSSAAWEISRIFGIGYERAAYVLHILGVCDNIALTHLNFYKFEGLVILFKIHYMTDDRLLYNWQQRLLFFANMKLRRGLRVQKGLPIRGQRTHHNNKTNKYHLKKTRAI